MNRQFLNKYYLRKEFLYYTSNTENCYRFNNFKNRNYMTCDSIIFENNKKI